MDDVLDACLIGQFNTVGEREEGVTCHGCTLKGESESVCLLYSLLQGVNT